MLSMVGLKRAFMASGLILSMPCEDHFTKSTLWAVAQRETGGERTNCAQRHRQAEARAPAGQLPYPRAERGFKVLGNTLNCQDLGP